MSQTPRKPQPETASSLRQRAESLRARVPERSIDPVLVHIREGRKLLQICQKARLLPDTLDGTRPRAEHEATDALIDHLRGSLLESEPSTPVGAVALAKYAIEVHCVLRIDLMEEMSQILALIARVRLA